MELDKEVHIKQVLKRFPPGDRWTPVKSEEPVFSSLTEGIEWVFQQTKSHDFLIKAAEGAVFIYTEEEKPVPEPEKLKFDFIPIGEPVSPCPNFIQVMLAVPDTLISPALTADIDARDPHNADAPSFVNLFIVNSFLCLLLFI